MLALREDDEEMKEERKYHCINRKGTTEFFCAISQMPIGEENKRYLEHVVQETEKRTDTTHVSKPRKLSANKKTMLTTWEPTSLPAFLPYNPWNLDSSYIRGYAPESLDGQYSSVFVTTQTPRPDTGIFTAADMSLGVAGQIYQVNMGLKKYPKSKLRQIVFTANYEHRSGMGLSATQTADNPTAFFFPTVAGTVPQAWRIMIERPIPTFTDPISTTEASVSTTQLFKWVTFDEFCCMATSFFFETTAATFGPTSAAAAPAAWNTNFLKDTKNARWIFDFAEGIEMGPRDRVYIQVGTVMFGGGVKTTRSVQAQAYFSTETRDYGQSTLAWQPIIQFIFP